METKAITNLSRISNENFNGAFYYAPKISKFQHVVMSNYEMLQLDKQLLEELRKTIAAELSSKNEDTLNKFCLILNIKKQELLDDANLFKKVVCEVMSEKISQDLATNEEYKLLKNANA
jgi:hypothetical protein